MRNSVGNPVEGDDFYGRDTELKQIWRRLETDHLLMLAARRIGKTSILKRLRDTGEDHGMLVVVCSFAACGDKLNCIEKIIASLGELQETKEQMAQKIKKALSHIKGFSVGPLGLDLKDVDREQWRQVGESLANILSQFDKQVVVCVDELPIFVLKLLGPEDNKENVKTFLNWFRDLRQQHTKAVKWILAGSLGLDTVTARLGISDTINDLTPYPLEAFDSETAQGLLQKLATNYELTIEPEVALYIVERIGWAVPYYLQVMFMTIRDKLSETKKNIEVSDVDEAFEELLRPPYKAYFDYWRQRLAEELGSPDDEHAITLLNSICRDKNGAKKDTLSQELSRRIQDASVKQKTLNYLLEVLESDGYLIVNQGRYQFRLHWLREYWKRRVAA